jgi:hypothetical protein
MKGATLKQFFVVFIAATLSAAICLEVFWWNKNNKNNPEVPRVIYKSKGYDVVKIYPER